MLYNLLVISRIERDDRRPLAVMTFYPTLAATLIPRPYERIAATYCRTVQLELAETLSAKGRARIKLVLSAPRHSEDERREVGAMFYSQMFGSTPPNDETHKGIADILYYSLSDLLTAEITGEDQWQAACEGAAESVLVAAKRWTAAQNK